MSRVFNMSPGIWKFACGKETAHRRANCQFPGRRTQKDPSPAEGEGSICFGADLPAGYSDLTGTLMFSMYRCRPVRFLPCASLSAPCQRPLHGPGVAFVGHAGNGLRRIGPLQPVIRGGRIAVIGDGTGQVVIAELVEALPLAG